MKQMSLIQEDGRFAESDVRVEPETEPEKRNRDKEKYPEEYCLEQIRKEEYLWDMRFWREQSREEAMRWISSPEICHKNCGHTVFCIKLLRDVHEVPVETIVDAVMANDKVKFHDAEYLGESVFAVKGQRVAERDGQGGKDHRQAK